MNRKEYMRLRYNETASGYDELYAEEQWEKYTLASRCLSKWPGGRLCDIGCGTLLYLEHVVAQGLLERVNHYVGLDLSEGMLQQARRRLDKLHLGHLVEIVQADAENIPLRGKVCGIAVSFTVIDLVEDPGRMLAELDRIAGTSIVSSLKKAHRMKGSLPRLGVYIGETDKDVIAARGSLGTHCKPSNQP